MRANQSTLKRLRRLREATGESTADLLDQAVDLLERDRFLDSANAAFARVRDDPAARREEEAERAMWEETLLDGLEE